MIVVYWGRLVDWMRLVYWSGLVDWSGLDDLGNWRTSWGIDLRQA